MRARHPARRYQNGVPFLMHSFSNFGISLSYDVFDFGEHRAAISAREAKLGQARENVERLKEELSVRIEQSYDKVDRTRKMP